MKIWQAVLTSIAGFFALIVLIIVLLLQATAPLRSQNRDFFDALRAADRSAIKAAVHPSLADHDTYIQIMADLNPRPAFVSYRFNSHSWRNGTYKGQGMGLTANGCRSALVIERRQGLVTRFSIYGNC